jgi:hypothetical protein
MKRSISALLITLIMAALPMTASAKSTGFQFSFFDLNAPAGDEVGGVKITAIYGKSGSVTGWDFPILAISESASLKGVSFGAFLTGSIIRGEMTGATLGVFTMQEGQSTGVNVNALNMTNNLKGVNFGAVNWSKGFTVADVSLVNISEKSNFQLGLVNVTEEINGVQIGLLSCAKNGFLPCFVLFNFGGM